MDDEMREREAQVTVLARTNVDSSHKLLLLGTGKSAPTVCFKNIKIRFLIVDKGNQQKSLDRYANVPELVSYCIRFVPQMKKKELIKKFPLKDVLILRIISHTLMLMI